MHFFGIGTRHGAEIGDRGLTASSSGHGRAGTKIAGPTLGHLPFGSTDVDRLALSIPMPLRDVDMEPGPGVLGVGDYLLPKGGKVSGTRLVSVVPDEPHLGEVQLTGNIVECVEEGR